MKFSVIVFNALVLLLQCPAPVLVGQQPSAVKPAPVRQPEVPVAVQASNATSSSPQAQELVIASGDLLQVKMYGAEDFATEARVSAAGEISLPLIGSLHVAGMTTAAAEYLVENRLKDGGFYNEPDISIIHKEFTDQGISVLGEVQKPGILPLMGQRKLFDVISAAGGMTQRAGNRVLITRRNDPGNTIIIMLSKDPTATMKSNVDVLPGDTVVVTKAGIVYVVGDVRLPGGFTMDNGNQMTILQAISMAQGTNPTAALGGSKLIRRTPNGPQEIPVSLKNILAGKANDQILLDEDIVFVPSSVGKSAMRRSVDAILQVATGVAVYRR